uniref:Translation initiation factor eIF2B subunit epsilon n=1 Tax=Pseudo-nitzschia arenysensis TaxID=697910 RepID=A0A7R9ZUB4_9STRA|mmetsp:Transcript_969/g.2244  ORF Transcript_969/g.2244 Transcript_969/m.2244 type:complete len:934 (+) Transcript_969:238-3039(+)|eukprot:CAMPEP_0116146024 /NCGR_PEP_ID=MMETSP0329-20121206/16935_1 /TAXON_ID=697910 /ORGANISM="Pseudo-nitzschia arenysensis, Strain B593" /LENGTH=933 /DNA_ID=CAMNT_0003641727 /DNA_START=208 /DNA_END=3009 /DNA_ORIENTATION=+
MPKQNKKKNDDDDLKQEGNVKLQAVLLADFVFGSKVTKREDYQSFGLRPWSAENSTSSQTLCKINNLPLVEYILDFLASNGVEQVIIVTGSESAMLEEYLNKSSSSNHKRSFELLFLKDTSLTNAGDALRELYKRNWIRASKQALPFLLVSGDVVADLDLREAMKAHKDRHSHDSAAVMTVVLKPVSSTLKSKDPSIVPRACDLVVGLVSASSKTAATADAQGSEKDPTIDDSKDYRILYYDNGGNASSCTLPCAFLTQCQTQTNGVGASGGLVVRHDLLDTGIAICSPDVLGRLEDEFDYLDLAHDFVTNCVAEEEDGLQTRIYAHVLEDATIGKSSRNYAARAVDFQTYHAISRDLLQRWAYPTVADRMMTIGAATGAASKRYKLVKVADHNHHRRSATHYNRPLRSITNVSTNDSKNDPFSKISTNHNNNQYQYKEVLNPTKVGRTSVVVGQGIMGSYGSVGEDCLLARCVLGDSVTIGDASKLVDCHLLDNVVIESGATLDSCVLAAGSVVKAGATLGTGCYIGEGCVVGAGITLKPFTRVTMAKDDDDDDWGDDDDEFSDSDDNDSDENTDFGEEKASGDCDVDLLGPDGRGKLWKPALDDDDFSDDEDEDADSEEGSTDPLEVLLQLQSIGGDPTSYFRKETRRLAKREAQDLEDDGFSDQDDEEDELMAETQAFSEFTGGTVTFGDDDGDNLNYTGSAMASAETVIGRQKGIDVVREMTEICMEFDDECHPIENLAIELNSFKFSQNATYSDCASACLLSLLRKMEISQAMTDGRMVSLLKAKLDKFWTGMLQKICRGVDEEVSILEALEHAATIDQHSQPSSQDTDAVDAFQKSTDIAQKLRSGMAFRFFLQTLHDQEVLSEESILKWAADHRKEGENDKESEDPKQSLFQMQSVQDFLEWLDDDDSDSDDDSDDDDGDSDEDSD